MLRGRLLLLGRGWKYPHLEALFSPPQHKQVTERGQRSPTAKTKPKLLP